MIAIENNKMGKKHLTKNHYLQALTYSYLKKGLQGIDDSRLGPIKDAFLLLLDDFLKKKVSLKELDFICQEFWKLNFFTNNIFAEDAEFAWVLDSTLVLSHPEVEKTLPTKEEKEKHALKTLREYLKNNRSHLTKLKNLIECLEEKKLERTTTLLFPKSGHKSILTTVIKRGKNESG